MKEIILTQDKVTLVDDKDFDYLNQWKWSAQKGAYTFYARRKSRENGKQRTILMHRLILGLTDRHILGDHRDHNGLNNQRYNLRVVSHTQNRSNSISKVNATSKYLGVDWRASRNKWRARIKKNNKTKHLGHFCCEIEAAEAYNKAAIEIHGEFANLNLVVT